MPRPAMFSVEMFDCDWLDVQRGREVPVRIYHPVEDAGRRPVILFSHGLGGSREGYEYLGRHWASRGYVSIHMQHRGSDSDVWRGKSHPQRSLREALADPKSSLDRPADVRFVINRLERHELEASPLAGKLDLDKIGAAGHSFGAFTTIALGSDVAVTPEGIEFSAPETRVKAGVVMSAPIPPASSNPGDAFATLRIPCLFMTGTRDDSPVAETKAQERRMPFDHCRLADRYLLVLNGGDHLVFSGRGQSATQSDLQFQELIAVASTLFWDAYLCGDAAAKASLAEGEFAATLGKRAAFEAKTQ